MKFAATVLLGALAAVSMVDETAAVCSTQPWQQCGKNDGTTWCCPSGQYCQPWDTGNIQCQNTPPRCSKILTHVDYPGNDIKTVYGIQPAECCAQCDKTPGCAVYTFINYRAGPPACYLKRAAGKQVRLVGAISGFVNGKKQRKYHSKQNNGCSTPAWGSCGNSNGAKCCPSGQYCQPWNPGYYQCMQIPSKCPKQYTDVDFPGNDIGKAQAGNNEECCAACTKNPRCKAYTFVNYNNNGPQCYLKSGANGSGIKKVGAVSGKL